MRNISFLVLLFLELELSLIELMLPNLKLFVFVYLRLLLNVLLFYSYLLSDFPYPLADAISHVSTILSFCFNLSFDFCIYLFLNLAIITNIKVKPPKNKIEAANAFHPIEWLKQTPGSLVQAYYVTIYEVSLISLACGV